jgi:hypothetical protein
MGRLFRSAALRRDVAGDWVGRGHHDANRRAPVPIESAAMCTGVSLFRSAALRRYVADHRARETDYGRLPLFSGILVVIQ